MEQAGKIVFPAVFAFLMPAAAMGQEVSSMTAKTPLEVSKVLSEQNGPESDKALQDWYFDRSPLGGFQSAALVKGKYASKGNTPQYRPSPLKPLTNGKVPPPVSKEKLSSKPGVEQNNLDKLTVSPDGNLYKIANENPWWKFWASERSIQKAVPDDEGNMWNNKGEFTGNWKTVMKTNTEDFQVVKGKDGQDHIYTMRYGDNSGMFTYTREIYRDGKLATSFNSDFQRHSLGQVKAGADDKPYAKYSQKETEDIILTPDQESGQFKTAARVPVEYREWTDTHTRQVPHSVSYRDSKGRTQYKTEYRTERYTEHHEERFGADKYEVSENGKVFTLFKGNVFTDTPNGDRNILAGNPGGYHTGQKVPHGNIRDFKVDSNGNLYTTSGGLFEATRVAVNNVPNKDFDLGMQDLRVDNSGNIYTAESAGWFHGDYLKRVNMLADPQNAAAAAK